MICAYFPFLFPPVKENPSPMEPDGGREPVGITTLKRNQHNLSSIHDGRIFIKCLAIQTNSQNEKKWFKLFVCL